ncbi:MAG: nucleoside-triphosphatase [Anaerolineales bacterium]
MQETQISPVDLVTWLTTTAEKEYALILVTGERGSGKTAWCLELIRQARSAGVEPVGLVSPAVFEDGVKIAIDLIYITTGERRRLAAKRDYASACSLVQSTGLANLHWLFDTTVLAWGNQILEGLQHGELLILDELGPLELLENIGLTAGIEQINQRRFNLSCVVVRPALLENALERWPWAREIYMTNQPVGGDQQ